ncbi:Transcription initiation factor TFIID subunit 2 [Apiospora saccharicola]|uniref:Transcription initiation factor TFIID subunit 2 n=1 Tax=Apiospora saccharicola TaxID=335842 RepID=A0ABR1VL99_9PEZI
MPGAIIEPDQVPAQDGDAGASGEPPIEDTPVHPYSVFREQVWLDFDLREKAVKGRADIFISVTDDSLDEIFIDARQCNIDTNKITVSGCPAKAVYEDPYAAADTPAAYEWGAQQWAIRKHRMRSLLHRRRKELSATDHEKDNSCTPLDGSLRVTLPSLKDRQAGLIKLRDAPLEQKQQKPDPADKHLQEMNGKLFHKITIPFTLRNIRDGLQFVGVDEADSRYPHLYTLHSVEPGIASCIFPCIDDPGCRSSWKISLTFPRTLGDAFQRAPVAQSSGLLNGNRKRKHGEDEPRRRGDAFTEEDKLLELTAVCSGKLEDETLDSDDETKKTMTFECHNKAARHIGFTIGPFEHVDLWSEFRTEEDDTKLGSNATKVHGYCLPGRAEEVRNTCAAIVTAIDQFAMNFGRYPFDNYKICFVDDMVANNVPLCGFSIASTRLLYPREIIDTEIETTRILVHSLACQWFGINIIPNTSADVWLVVGIAWFMTDYFMKFICGNNHYRFTMKAKADQLIEVDMNRPSLHTLGEHLHLGDFEVEFMDLKAPLVLFILDRRLSKSSSSAPIVRLINKMVSKANTSGDQGDEILASEPFRKACEKQGQTRLESFWNQWILGSGCPRFDVYQKFNKKRLCVEMTIRQVQDIAAHKARALEKDAFWGDVLEETHSVWAGELQHCFSGPMTIRIHEADGTPYEHIVEIKEDTAKSIKFEIPYNTKYKRLKRSRRQRDRQIAANTNKTTEENQEDGALLYSLGDVLQGQDDVEEWGLHDWNEDQEAQMDQESYEWIRMDADFEWVCTMKTNMQPYMYVSQLQQDRDVVAQQDSMLYMELLSHKNGAHPLASTILTRTLRDARYFHGIRTMAATILQLHAVDGPAERIGLKHLLKVFQVFFCYEGTYTPKPNDFFNKQQYLIQCAIIETVAKVRDRDGKCPEEARRFILEQLRSNNNEENCFSDQFYICKLIKALATCQIPDEKKTKTSMSMSMSFGDRDEDEDGDEVAVDKEPLEFKKRALEEIDRYRRMDEYSPSYQNCFTVAALDALCQMMKAKVIPTDPLVFVQYLQDKTIDVVRIKGFEAMVELGHMSHPVFLRFLLSVIGTDSSPFVRSRLFKIFCRGLASIAIGEHEDPEKDKPAGNESGLIVDDTALEAKQQAKARRENLNLALGALKEKTKDDFQLQKVVWDSLNSPVLTVAERRNMIDMCSILFEEDEQLTLRFNYPVYWTVARGDKQRNKLPVHFRRHFRTRSRKKYKSYAEPVSASAAKPEQPKRTITLNLNRNPSLGPVKAASPSASPLPPVVVKPSASEPKPVPKPTPKPVVKPIVKPATPKPVPSVAKSTPTVTVSASRPEPPKPKPVSPVKEALKDKEARRDSISVQAPRPSVEKPHLAVTAAPATPATLVKATSPAGSSERRALPSVGSQSQSKPPGVPKPKERDDFGKSRDGSGKPKEIKELKIREQSVKPRDKDSPRDGVPNKPKESSSKPNNSIFSQKPKDRIFSNKTSLPSSKSSGGLPGPGKNSGTISGKSSGGNSPASLSAPQLPKTLKRPSNEPSESPRPTKIVKLNTKGLPAHIFKKRSKVVTVKFNAWHKLKRTKPSPPSRMGTPSAGSDAGSIRASSKSQHSQLHQSSKHQQHRASSVGFSKHSKSQSPHVSTPTSVTNNSFPSPPMRPTQTVKTSSAKILSGTNNGNNNGSSNNIKTIRKPLPGSNPGGGSSGGGGSGGGSSGGSGSSSHDRRPLPSAGRTSLPSGGSPHTPHQQPPPSNNTPSSLLSGTKSKIKIKVKPTSSSQQ